MQQKQQHIKHSFQCIMQV